MKRKETNGTDFEEKALHFLELRRSYSQETSRTGFHCLVKTFKSCNFHLPVHGCACRFLVRLECISGNKEQGRAGVHNAGAVVHDWGTLAISDCLVNPPVSVGRLLFRDGHIFNRSGEPRSQRVRTIHERMVKAACTSPGRLRRMLPPR